MAQPDFAALNRGRHLYSAGRPSRWVSAHILVVSSTSGKELRHSDCGALAYNGVSAGADLEGVAMGERMETDT